MRPQSPSRTPTRLGLRGHLIIALSIVFTASFILLSATLVKVTQRDEAQIASQDRQRLTAILSPVLANASEHELRATLEQLMSEHIIAGAHLGPPDPRANRSDLKTKTHLFIERPEGRLDVSFTKRPSTSRLPMQRLLLFYAGLTGLCTLLLAYVLLTTMLVRPLETTIVGAEALARGDLHSRVPLRGAAEMVRLAQAFNHMAEALRNDRQELTQNLENLQRATAELQLSQAQVIHGEKLASVGRMAAGVAHEIGNPLAAIIGLIEVLREGELPAEQLDEFLRRIQVDAERINEIIASMLRYARKDAVPTTTVREVCNVQTVVKHTLALLNTDPRTRNVHLNSDLAEAPLQAALAPSQLSQVVLNLVVNGLDAAGGSDVKGRVDVRAFAADNTGCLLTVEDNGPGIDRELEGTIFEPFTTSKPPGKGTGLGLAVCHNLVTETGGTIQAENLPGRGARFTVFLPAPHPS